VIEDRTARAWQQETRIPIMRKQFAPKQDKVARAQAIRGYIAMNGLHVPMKAAWYPAFAQELLSFPVSKTDDQIDALVQMLEVMVPPKLASNVVRIRPLPKDYVPAQELERDQQGWTFKML
jgi:phage terminase large subunit-like protein